MYQPRTAVANRDLEMRWHWPDHVFFACGACHILAFAFRKQFPALVAIRSDSPTHSDATPVAATG